MNLPLLILPLLAVALTWLTWEVHCNYEAIVRVGYVPDGFHELHACDDPKNCPEGVALFEEQCKDHRDLRIKGSLLVLDLIVIAVLLTRLSM